MPKLRLRRLHLYVISSKFGSVGSHEIMSNATKSSMQCVLKLLKPKRLVPETVAPLKSYSLAPRSQSTFKF